MPEVILKSILQSAANKSGVVIQMKNDVEKVKLSIIVPVYNTARYLTRCIDSIRAQSFRNFEVILIDDCSPDGAGSICDDYAKQDNRICVIHKSQQEGVAAARNIGIKYARGEFIGFVDSDDYISPNMYETLFTIQQQYDADITICGITEFRKEEEIVEYESEYQVHTYNQKEYAEIFFKVTGNRTVCYMPNKLFRREVAQNMNFPVGLTSEDVLGFFQALCVSKVIVESTMPLYWYFYNTSGITHSGFSERDFHLLKIWNMVVAYSNKYAPQYEQYARVNRKRIPLTLLYRMNSQRIIRYPKQEKQLREELKMNARELLFSKIPFSRKVVLVGYMLNYRITAKLLGLKSD